MNLELGEPRKGDNNMPLTPDEEKELSDLENQNKTTSGLSPAEEAELIQLETEEKANKSTDLGEAGITGLEQYGSMATFGLTDVASPALGATMEHAASSLGLGSEALEGKSWIERYREYRDEQRATREQHVQEHPTAALVGGLTGVGASALLMPAGAASKVASISKLGKTAEAVMGASPKLAQAAKLTKAAKAASAAGDTAKGVELASQAAKLKRAGYAATALKGGAGAGVYGAAESEGDLTKGEFGQVAKDAALSAGLGTGLGLAAPALGAATKGIVKNPMLLTATAGGLVGLAAGHPTIGLTMGLFAGYAVASPRVANAFKTAFRGVEDFSASALNSAKSPFVQKLTETVENLKAKFGTSARKQIEDAFGNASAEVAQAANKKGKDFYDMVYSMKQELKEAYDAADKAIPGGKVDPREYFAKAKEIIENKASALSPAEKEELMSRIAGAEFKPATQVEKKIILGPETDLNATEFRGKGMSPRELERQSKAIPADEWVTKKSSVRDTKGMEKPLTTETQQARIPGAPVTEMSPAQMRDFFSGFGETAAAGEGALSSVANDVANQLRNQFAIQTNTVALNQKYNAFKEIMERQLKVKLPNDPMRINQADLDKILNIIKDTVKSGNNATNEVLMREFDKISPGVYKTWANEASQVVKKEATLGGGRGKDVLQQKAAMEAAGIPTQALEAPASTLSTIEKAGQEFGTPDAASRYITEIAAPVDAKNLARANEVREFTNALKQYAPDLVQELQTKGLDISRYEDAVSQPKFHPTILATYKHAIEPVFLWGAKLAGKSFNTLMSMPPEILNKMPALAKTVDMLKRNPGLQKSFIENSETRKLIFTASQAKEDLPEAIAPWGPSLFNAANRGLSALLAKNYIIQQQDAEYRKALNEYEKE